MKKLKSILIIVFVVLVFFSGIYVAFALFHVNSFSTQVTTLEAVNKVVENKLNMEEAIIEGFQSRKELITLETELSDIVEWDDSWGTFDIFHKSQRIRFYGTGIFTTDLNLLEKEDITVDKAQKIITVTLPKPVIKSITIDEDKTEYESIEKGWLRFGSISLKPEQYNAVYAMVKENMQRQMESFELREKAESSTKAKVKEIFQLIADSIEYGYSVQIIWDPDSKVQN